MKVSIVTPSFNQGRFIERTLKSVSIQTGIEMEHVVFDGGSTDNTVEILKSFIPSVRWVSQKDKGQADAVNKGISATNGEILGWLNSDDIYYPGAIARVVSFFEGNPDIDVVYGMGDYIDSNDQVFDKHLTETWCFERLIESNFICQPAVFFRRRVIDKYGLLDESLNFCMDYEYWLRLGMAGVQFYYLEEKLAAFRVYADTKTSRAKVELHRETNNMLKKKFGQVPEVWLFRYALVFVEDRVGRRASFWISFEIGIRTLLAALRWNRKISGKMTGFVIQRGRSTLSFYLSRDHVKRK